MRDINKIWRCLKELKFKRHPYEERVYLFGVTGYMLSWKIDLLWSVVIRDINKMWKVLVKLKLNEIY